MPTRWKLRKAIRRVNQTLNELRVELHGFLIRKGFRSSTLNNPSSYVKSV
jgi:hypothetical protein